MEQPAPKKAKGRPKTYKGTKSGAPQMTIRFDPDVHDWLKANHPEGARDFLQGLIRPHMKKAPPG